MGGERPDERARRAGKAERREKPGRGPGAERREHTERPERPRRSWYARPLPIAVAVLVVVLGLGAVVFFTPVLSVREIEVTGAATVPESDVRTALAVPDGQPLARVDTGAAAMRVAELRKVASARVQRVYPSTVRVTVEERTPMVFVQADDGPHLLDRDGVDFETAPPPPGVPELVAENAGFGDPATEAALGALSGLPAPLRDQVTVVRASTISDVEFTLADERIVLWGADENAERKAAVTLALLTQPGGTFDVSSPDLPTVR
ncbi:cell division protein FtsQ [Rhodococcus rhodnii]|uniref:Cell division protein FtsQ n=1 Tax=Rhodococcus rhodnii TaxID=38312 RepID=A0A6P2CF77_9NOCA|nr:cell division protein FtsQ [Rhodococcus rhodnii]